MKAASPPAVDARAGNHATRKTMASKKTVEVAAEVQEEGGKKKGKGLVLVAGVVVLTLALGGGGAWFLLSGKKEAAPGEALAEAKHKAEPPVFATLDPFVVNLAGEEEHYLQVGINLKVADPAVTEQIKTHLPEVRNAVLLLLSSKHPEELATLEGKNRLRHEIRMAVNGPLGVHTPVPVDAVAVAADAGEPAAAVPAAHASETPAPDVHDAGGEGVLEVLLTSFVIQ
jgi:flagellar FliL protein